MHIPSIINTTEIEIFDFEQALLGAIQKNENYDVKKWLNVPCMYSEYRYILGTRGENPLICIGINPSTAVPDNLDNTLKSVERVAHFNGFDSFIMFNVYAQRATNPADMEKSMNIKLHKENMKAFEYVLQTGAKKKPPCVWAAWGTIIEKRPFLIECLKDMVEIAEKYDADWVTAGKKSKTGHPHHPLYLPKKSVIESFSIELYIKNLLNF